MSVNFEVLYQRVLDHLRHRVQNGELTERGLSRHLGVSQPHMHNVLKGVRILTQDLADEILRYLGMSILDFVKDEEIGLLLKGNRQIGKGEIALPVLKGWLGPGRPFPDREPVEGWVIVPSSGMERVRDPALVFLAPETGLESSLPGAVVALLDFDLESAQARRRSLWCALSLPSGGFLRHVAFAGSSLRVVYQRRIWCALEELPGFEEQISRSAARAAVLWVGRTLPGPSGLNQEGFLTARS